jgi:hypothetical protein
MSTEALLQVMNIDDDVERVAAESLNPAQRRVCARMHIRPRDYLMVLQRLREEGRLQLH